MSHTKGKQAKVTGTKTTEQPMPVSSKEAINKQTHQLLNVWQLTIKTAVLIWNNKKLLFGIIAIYGLLNLLLVQGLAASTDVGSLKEQLSQAFTGNFGSIASSMSVLLVLVGSAGNGSSQTAGAYQLFLALIASLAIIWSLRQIFAKSKLRIRDAYYKGMYPLVPFILVLMVIGVQLLPLAIGSSIYSIVISNGIAVLVWEKALWALLYAALAFASIYLISSSIFALYIVTLPDMTPIKALRSAKDLVKNRRWSILRKILWIPLLLMSIAVVIMLPIILLMTALAQWVFFALTMSSLLIVHAYLYTLYRELLDE